MKTRIVIISIVAMLLLVLIVAYFLVPRKYEQNYMGVLGIPNDSSYRYNDMVDNFGEPISIEWDDKTPSSAVVKYDRLYFLCYTINGEPYDKESLNASEVFVTSSDFEFGKDKLKVGSTKRDVLWAYMKTFARIDADAPKDTISLVDGRTNAPFNRHVIFYFDANDLVYQIGIWFFP